MQYLSLPGHTCPSLIYQILGMSMHECWDRKNIKRCDGVLYRKWTVRHFRRRGKDGEGRPQRGYYVFSTAFVQYLQRFLNGSACLFICLFCMQRRRPHPSENVQTHESRRIAHLHTFVKRSLRIALRFAPPPLPTLLPFDGNGKNSLCLFR